MRKKWLQARGGESAGAPWRKGACTLLQLLRARWCEAACVVARAGPRAAVDAADAKARAAILAWQFVGRDCGARWLAFVSPTSAALSSVAGKGGGGVVELGAGNGYWAGLLRKRGLEVDALDVSPPELAPLGAPGDVIVRHGSAEDLAGSPHQTLLLCMPPPGEEGCADDALERFKGRRVAYVGEWGTGMTGTRAFHKQLERSFALRRRQALPCWPLLRAELFVFERERGGARGSGRSAPEQASSGGGPILACDACGRAPAVGAASGAGLRRCPWSRQLCICSEACYEASREDHLALLSVCFCGAAASSRPPLAEWEPCGWLGHAEAGGSRRWSALREATPQDERRPKDF